jgi:hypothetical protein
VGIVLPDVQVLIGVVATDFPGALSRLLSDLAADVVRSRLSRSDVAVLVLENSRVPGARATDRAITAASELEVAYVDAGAYGRSIASSRHDLTGEIGRWAASGRRAAVYWMIDDDLRFERLSLGPGLEVSVVLDAYLAGWLHLRATSPEIDLAVGSVTGDPPIRPEMMIRTQLGDLWSNLRSMSRCAPSERYVPARTAVFARPDYYYDLSEHGDAHLAEVAPWLPDPAAGQTVRDQLLAMLTAAADLPLGRAVTRPVLESPGASARGRADDCRRGGNAAFFDLHACLSHAYPRLRVADVPLRRADMIGAALLREQGFTVRRVPIALRHERSASGRDARGRRRTASDVWESITSEFFGVLVARLVMEPSEEPRSARAGRIARSRAARLVANLRSAGELVDRLAEAVARPAGWLGGDAEVAVALSALRGALDELLPVVGGRSRADRDAWLAALDEHLTSPRHLDEAMGQAAEAERESRGRASRAAVGEECDRP